MPTTMISLRMDDETLAAIANAVQQTPCSHCGAPAGIPCIDMRYSLQPQYRLQPHLTTPIKHLHKTRADAWIRAQHQPCPQPTSPSASTTTY